LQPSWSSDGYLAFYDSNQSAFVILDPASRNTSLFPNQTGQPGVWHPGGRYFVAPEINFLDTNISENLSGLQALANSHLMLFDRQLETTQDLSLEIEAEDTSPSFSSDGTVLAFARKYLDTQRWTPGRQVWMMHLSPDLEPGSSSQAHPLTASPDFNHYELAWNPNGEQIAYVRFNQTIPIEPPEIWLLDPFTGRSVKLITGGYAPAWIP
jgi:dipeptidyl aminopeptidase/acylaminoacyl peptidase